MFFKRRKSTFDKVSKITNSLDKAFKVFQEALNKVEAAQIKLEKTIEESDKRVESLQFALEQENQYKERAKQAMTTNEIMKEKLKDFTF